MPRPLGTRSPNRRDTVLTLRLTSREHAHWASVATQTGIPLSDLVRTAVRRYIEHMHNQPPNPPVKR